MILKLQNTWCFHNWTAMAGWSWLGLPVSVNIFSDWSGDPLWNGLSVFSRKRIMISWFH